MAKNTKGLGKLWQPSEELGRIVGNKALPRPEITKEVWAYIKEKGLQDEDDRRYFHPDAALSRVFGGEPVHMLEVQKHLSKHLEALS